MQGHHFAFLEIYTLLLINEQEMTWTSTTRATYCVNNMHYYYYYWYSALGPVWAETEFSQATGMALVRCILGKFLGVAFFLYKKKAGESNMHYKNTI